MLLTVKIWFKPLKFFKRNTPTKKKVNKKYQMIGTSEKRFPKIQNMIEKE